MANAPVCHASTDQVIEQPPPVQFPSVPRAVDLQSALAAINALTRIVMMLAGQQPAPWMQGPQGVRGAAGKNAPPGKKPRWAEVNRVMKKVKIENPSDSAQFVEIERIERLVMRDSVTGQTWDWKR